MLLAGIGIIALTVTPLVLNNWNVAVAPVAAVLANKMPLCLLNLVPLVANGVAVKYLSYMVEIFRLLYKTALPKKSKMVLDVLEVLQN